MADSTNLELIPKAKAYSIVTTEGRFSLISRAREDAARLVLQPPQEPRFAAASMDWEKWGFIDPEGEFMVEPRFYADASHLDASFYDYCGVRFSYSYRVGPYGFLDHQGKVTIKPAFDNASFFTDGLAGVKVKEKWGFITKDGKFAISPRFEKVPGVFRDGLCRINFQGAFGFIDSTGDFVIPPRFECISIGGFNQGLALASLGGKWGYIDKSGQFVIPPRFEFANGFCEEGLAHVKWNSKRALIGLDGKIVFQPNDPGGKIGAVTGGTAYVTDGGSAYFINLLGKQITNPLTTRAMGDFSEGLGRIAVRGRELIGYIDNLGQMKIKPQFEAAGDFNYGRACVYTTRGECKWIDREGNFIDGQEFEIAGKHCEGLSRIKDRNLFGYIDDSAKIVIEPQYESADDFVNGRAKIEVSGRVGFIDRTGKIAIPPNFARATNFR